MGQDNRETIPNSQFLGLRGFQEINYSIRRTGFREVPDPGQAGRPSYRETMEKYLFGNPLRKLSRCAPLYLVGAIARSPLPDIEGKRKSYSHRTYAFPLYLVFVGAIQRAILRGGDAMRLRAGSANANAPTYSVLA
ncbi:MAG: hypothetical protein F6J93_39760 [Oscillatoria sp. SIO1A7]|nr:hypothetical protein [Oscillatoria sp. SIO1A7]